MSQSSVNQPRRGYSRSFNGLIGAMLAVLGLVAIFGVMSWIQHRPVSNPARTVHYSAALAAARHQAPFHVVAPEPLPSGLRATSVGWDTAGRSVTWHLGFVTSDQQYVGLYQSNGAPSAVIAASTPANVAGPHVHIAGQQWQTRSATGRDETALVHTAHGVTTVVTGTVGQHDLEVFASRLR